MEPSNTLIRISGPIPEVKKICIDQSLEKYCILGRMRKMLNICGEARSQESFAIFPAFKLGNGISST